MPSTSAASPEHLAHQALTRYLELCDVPRSPDASGTLADLFTPDAVWEGVGPLYTEKFGRTTGPAAIAAMLAAYLPPNPHFRANAHLLHPGTTHVEGDEVRGRWLMQQVSRYESGAAELIVARLDVTFRVAADGARIRHFRTERLFDAGLGPSASDLLQEAPR
ncbi:nuclear transport factor 2 family protein [Streptomyces sp. NPDC044780]|uniref:nuclear transport factor 2 family protein n=1 Tax=unclassified Streptomyces TaxID=2593676 RepID=UPI0033F7AC86